MDVEQTRRVVDELYQAFLRGDPDGMLATFADDIEFRFLGQIEATGIDAARRFITDAAGKLTDLDFTILHTVIDGDRAAVTWSETARTAAGAEWVNHGVDVIEVRDGRVTSLHENNDVRLVYEHFGRPGNDPEGGGSQQAGV